MNILLAPDSFKGSLSAFEVCRIMAQAIASLDQDIQVLPFPMADGGEGSGAVLQRHCGGQWKPQVVPDPLGRPIEAAYLALDSGLAVIEVAAASGLDLLGQDELDPMRASSRGTGELIAAALRAGHRELMVTLGGSATNDGGMGLLSALGYRFLDANSRVLTDGAEALLHLAAIDTSKHVQALDEARFLVACDVDNPLVGERGATRVFGPQKAVQPEQLEPLDQGMARFGEQLQWLTGREVLSAKGAGAAGGIGAALLAFTQAEFRPGFEIIAEMSGFNNALAEGGFDLVITGEGRLDAQTLAGKLPQAVAKAAARYRVPVLAVAGRIEATAEQVTAMGLVSAWELGEPGEATDILLAEAEPRLYATTRRALADFLDQQG